MGSSANRQNQTGGYDMQLEKARQLGIDPREYTTYAGGAPGAGGGRPTGVPGLTYSGVKPDQPKGEGALPVYKGPVFSMTKPGAGGMGGGAGTVDRDKLAQLISVAIRSRGRGGGGNRPGYTTSRSYGGGPSRSSAGWGGSAGGVAGVSRGGLY